MAEEATPTTIDPPAQSALADKLKNGRKAKPLPSPSPAMLHREDITREVLVEGSITADKIAIAAPFPIGARLKYVAQRYITEGYTRTPILEPGVAVTVQENVGAYSLYSLDSNSGRILMVIGTDDKRDWVQV